MMLYLATDHGVSIVEKGGNWRVVHSVLDGHRVTSIIAREGVVIAGTTDGIIRSEDEGRTWQGRQGIAGPACPLVGFTPQYFQL
jgi:hypothetical protein